MARDLWWNLRRNGEGTALLVVAIAGSFVLAFFGIGLRGLLAFANASALERPWAFLSYPFAMGRGDLLAALFGCLWLYGIGGQLERTWGRPRFLGFFFAMAALGALAFWVGGFLLGTGSVLAGPWMPLAAITVAWGTLFPNQPVTFMFVLPLTGRWLAWLSAILVFFSSPNPAMALFACTPLALAWAYAGGRLGSLGSARPTERSWRGTRDDPRYREDVRRRERERAERERLRRLFENSVRDEEDRR
ncbi:MAG: rhomboid family intramembrane serine protease [Fimbriimonadales bacterium]|nr:rhomboid family intramembrane serine protease [Fimbriimonadales bacterium]